MYYITCKYEIDSISNGGRVRIRMKNGEGGGGGTEGEGERYTQTLWGKSCFARVLHVQVE